jgi:hypothetical protein
MRSRGLTSPFSTSGRSGPTVTLATSALSGSDEGYRRMIALSPAGRAGTPDEIGTIDALLRGTEGAFITGSDFLMDGGAAATYRFGELASQ